MNKKSIKFNNRIILMNGATIKLNSTKRIFNYKLNHAIYKYISNDANSLGSVIEMKESKISSFYKKYNMSGDE